MNYRNTAVLILAIIASGTISTMNVATAADMPEVAAQAISAGDAAAFLCVMLTFVLAGHLSYWAVMGAVPYPSTAAFVVACITTAIIVGSLLLTLLSAYVN